MNEKVITRTSNTKVGLLQQKLTQRFGVLNTTVFKTIHQNNVVFQKAPKFIVGLLGRIFKLLSCTH